MTKKQFKNFIQKHQYLVYTIAYQFTRNEHSSRKLTNQIFLSAYQRRSDCCPEGRKAWLCKISVENCKEYLGRLDGAVPI